MTNVLRCLLGSNISQRIVGLSRVKSANFSCTPCCLKKNDSSWLPPEISEEELKSETTKNLDVTLPSARPTIPIISSRSLNNVPIGQKPRQSWCVNMDTIEEQRLGIVDLHPHVFGVYPRLDILHQNVTWQLKYKRVNYAVAKTRAEVRGGGRKPWKQKGTGRARHGSIRSPLWRGGGKSHGPRGPTTYFYMIDFYSRIRGLTTALSVKLAQNYLHVVDSLDIPTDDPDYLLQLQDQRNWGHSLLFVDDTDIMPRNIAIASDSIKYINLMPVYGLNVYSMLKHESVVITLAALEKIEEKLLFHLNRRDGLGKQTEKHGVIV